MSAPTTPPHVARDPPSTPPRLLRQPPSFLHPEVMFFHLVTGEPIDVGEERTILAVRCALAVKNDTSLECIEFCDMSDHQKIKDTEDCLLANVGVYFDIAVADMCVHPFVLDCTR